MRPRQAWEVAALLHATKRSREDGATEKKKEEEAKEGRGEDQHQDRIPVQWSGEQRRKGALLAYTLLEPLFISLE